MRNWTVKEAVEAINNGNQEAIAEVAKHYPLAFMAIVTNDLAGLAQYMGEKFTLRRLNFDVATTEAEEDGEDAIMTPPTKETKKAPKAKAVEAEEDATEDDGEEDLGAMSTKQLIELCGKRGIKVPKYGKNKQFYLDALQNAGDAEEVEEETEAEDAEEATDAYEGKSAMELYKECKARGIKVEAKKNAKYYIAALKKADEEAKAAEEEAEDDDWDDAEEEEEVKPKKTAKAPKAEKETKSSKKTTKKVEAEEEDDDDWDI